nr:hypothetical protein [Chitinophagales bacterium]
MNKPLPGQAFLDNFFFHNHRIKNILSIPFLWTGIVAIIFLISHSIFGDYPLWVSWKQASGNATHFCELNRFGQGVVQPSNTWSNLGFLFVSLVILSIAKKDHDHKDRMSSANY